jgi:hypothetical protein
VAARRETGRGRGDLFGGGGVEEEIATSAPPQATARGAGSSSFLGGGSGGDAGTQRSGLTGARDEHSVLFSLTALTNTSKGPSMPPSATSGGGSRNNEDSGLIDLNALARSQQQSRAAEAPAAPLATPFLFPAALGSMETFHAPESQKKWSMPMIIGGGLAVAGIAIALAIFAGGRKEEAPPLPAVSPVSSVAPEPPPPPMSAAAEASSSESPAPSAKVSAKKAGGGGARPNKPSAAPGGAGPTPPALPPPTPKAKSPCGCAGGDLQCQIRCSATGH